ncbi:hypothetical protein ACOMCU_01260 [Lysinibacillus sp. UGB7]|uniref:hypothetical protein n=1 Tax=Lysinibacillus sp. UGB7 TaxID=3411039 RepID=UPI003B7D56E5
MHVQTNEIHTLNMKDHYNSLKREIEVIERLKLIETSASYGNDRYDLKMFDNTTNIFYSVEAYNLKNKSVVLLVSKLRDDHADYYELENKFDDCFMEIDFKDYEDKYLPFLINREEAKLLIDSITK